MPEERDLRFSLVDVGNPMIFVAFETFGLSAADGPDEIDPQTALLARVERTRRHISRRYGLSAPDGSISENIPLLAVVGPPSSYVSYSSRIAIAAGELDLVSREFFAGRLHKAYGVGETVCTAAAAVLPGTLVNQVCRTSAADMYNVRIGHPSGVIPASVLFDGKAIKSITIERTARLIMKGVVSV
jgi:2-methylaconitate cis-trans-isomerase PrpF